MLLAIGIPVAVLLGISVEPIPWGMVAYGRFFLPTIAEPELDYREILAPEITADPNVPKTRRGKEPSLYCTYFGEGMNVSVVVSKSTTGVRYFHGAGKVQASTLPEDMRLQRLLGHISALLHKDPKSVLVVACGAGVTAGSFVVHPEVERIVICDIEPLVPKNVAPLFAKENHNVVEDPRTQVVSDDGRHYVRTAQEKFDIITSDPIDPWVKGCAALNTVEYYRACRDHLNEGGVMTLWVPLYESNLETAKSLFATFFEVFPNGIIWSNENNGQGYDVVLFGQKGPTTINLDELQARLDRDDHLLVRKSLAEVQFRSVVDVLSTYAGRGGDLKEWIRDAQLNTDKNLRLQYLAGMAFNTYVGSEILDDILTHYRFPEDVFVGSEERKQSLRKVLEQVGRVEKTASHSNASDILSLVGR
jgi:spermidine synthase